MQEIVFSERTTAQRYHVGDRVPVEIGGSGEVEGIFVVVRVEACPSIAATAITRDRLNDYRYELRRGG